MRKAIIIGAGPAGLTIAYELLKSKEYEVKIIEKDSRVGGLSKSYKFNGNRVDIGGHRYFTKNIRVRNFWNEILPVVKDGMLVKRIVSHILYNDNAIAYPIKINKQLIQSIGINNGIKVIGSYLYSMQHHVEEQNLEDFYINRFGKKLYKLFFEDYTKKLWGLPASLLRPDWGSQRIQSLSLSSVIKNIVSRWETGEKSLIQFFNYPTYGSGQIWEDLYKRCIREGGTFEFNSDVVGLEYDGKKISKVRYNKNGENKCELTDLVISSMPLKNFVMNIENCPREMVQVANKLKYRDMITISFFIEYKYVGTRLKENMEDCWMYIQEKTVKAGRLQILNNWSPNAVKNENGLLLQVEYYCNENDVLWTQEDNKLLKLAVDEMKVCGILSKDAIVRVQDFMINRIYKAYPVYDEAYNSISEIRNWIDGIEDLYCIGRNGRHIYGNIDQVMESAFCAFDVIKRNGDGKEKIWLVDQDKECIENNTCIME